MASNQQDAEILQQLFENDSDISYTEEDQIEVEECHSDVFDEDPVVEEDYVMVLDDDAAEVYESEAPVPPVQHVTTRSSAVDTPSTSRAVQPQALFRERGYEPESESDHGDPDYEPEPSPPRLRGSGRRRGLPRPGLAVRLQEEEIDDPQAEAGIDVLPPARGRAGRGRGRPSTAGRGRGRPRVAGRGRSRVQPVPEPQAEPALPPPLAPRPGRRGARRTPESFTRADRGEIRPREIRPRDLSPSQCVSYKRARGPMCQPGPPIIKFENLLPPSPLPLPEDPQAPRPSPPPSDINDPVTLHGHTWHNEKLPGADNLKRGSTRQPSPSELVSDCIESSMGLLDKFLPQATLEMIVRYTNIEAHELREKIRGKNKTAVTYADTNLTELRALLGFLIMSGDRKDNHLTADLLFEKRYGTTFYSCLFSQKRFEFLMRAIRFDDKEQRANSTDKFQYFREFWNSVIVNFSHNYIPGSILTVDEQLQGFRGRCAFRMYIANKPNKYGIKVFMVCDAQTGYCLNAIPYLGKGGHPEIQGQLQGTYFTMKLLEPLEDQMQEVVVCCDNWFTSMALVEQLQRIGAGLVGTTRPKKYLPFDAVKLMNLPIGESVALYDHDSKVNVVYTKVKSKKFVALLTTEHNAFSYVEKQKTEVHMHYNASKGGVDTFDMKCAASNTSRKTKRWTLCMFLNVLNMVINNMYIIFHSKSDKTRHWYNNDLAYKLARPWAIYRLGYKLPPYLTVAIRHNFDITEEQPQAAALPQEDEEDIDEPAAVVQMDAPAVRVQPQYAIVPVHPHPVEVAASEDPTFPGFPGGRVTTGIRKRCPFDKFYVRSRTQSGKQLCHRCKAAVCNLHSAVICPNCWHNLHQDPQ